MTFEESRISIFWIYRECRRYWRRILAVVVLALATGYGIEKLNQWEAARVAAFPPAYKAAIAEGEKILDSAKLGDFIETRGGVLLRVQEAGRNNPELDGIMVRVFPRLVNCANGRFGPLARNDSTLSRIVGRIPAVDGKPDPAGQARCDDQGAIVLIHH